MGNEREMDSGNQLFISSFSDSAFLSWLGKALDRSSDLPAAYLVYEESFGHGCRIVSAGMGSQEYHAGNHHFADHCSMGIFFGYR